MRRWCEAAEEEEQADNWISQTTLESNHPQFTHISWEISSHSYTREATITALIDMIYLLLVTFEVMSTDSIGTYTRKYTIRWLDRWMLQNLIKSKNEWIVMNFLGTIKFLDCVLHGFFFNYTVHELASISKKAVCTKGAVISLNCHCYSIEGVKSGSIKQKSINFFLSHVYRKTVNFKNI